MNLFQVNLVFPFELKINGKLQSEFLQCLNRRLAQITLISQIFYV